MTKSDGLLLAEKYFDYCAAELELDEALMLAFGATELYPGSTDPDSWPCGHMVYDDYDSSFELWSVKSDEWVPTPKQLEAAFALGFDRCWICYKDGTEIHCYSGGMGERRPSTSDRSNEAKYLQAKQRGRLASIESDLADWRKWAAFVFCGGGVQGTDAELQALACRRYDADVQVISAARSDMERIMELCQQFNIPDTDVLKHRLEDWERWNKEIRSGTRNLS